MACPNLRMVSGPLGVNYPKGVGGVKLCRHLSSSPSPHLPLLVSFSLAPRTTRTQCMFSCVLSSKIVLSLLGLSSSVLIFWGFSVIVVLISGSSVERKYVDANVDEGGP
jgi:hypothetical protein